VPTQAQVRWAQLRVGITVIAAAVILAFVVFLMTGTTGLFADTLELKVYFENAGGLRVGAPVRLEGVDIGNVTGIGIVPDRRTEPVMATMEVSSRDTVVNRLREDCAVRLSTAGVLGEVFVDIDCKTAEGAQVKDGSVLKSLETTELQDVVRASQTTLQNMDILLKRLDRIVGAVERGEGSVGKFIYDPALFNRVDATLKEFQSMVNSVARGEGTAGKLLRDEELYRKLDSTVAKLNNLIAEIDQGKGTIGKLLKDETVYNNLNQTVAKANKMMDDINSGRGAAGKLVSDPEFAAKLDRTMANIDRITARLEAGEGTAGKLLTDPSLYANADRMMLETRNLIQAVRENPKKYLTIHFRIF
jgi:phospholipid/cholesterol/gamma-HCH transport system substrate-binding protein